MPTEMPKKIGAATAVITFETETIPLLALEAAESVASNVLTIQTNQNIDRRPNRVLGNDLVSVVSESDSNIAYFFFSHSCHLPARLIKIWPPTSLTSSTSSGKAPGFGAGLGSGFGSGFAGFGASFGGIEIAQTF